MLFGNLHEETLRQVQNSPQHYTALIPFGAGSRLTQDHPNLSKDFETFLKSFRFDGSDRLQVTHPTPNLQPDPQTRFSKPFPYLLLHSPEPLHQLLLWQQTFAFQINARCLAFNAVRIDPQARSWVIVNFAGPFVSTAHTHMINTLHTITTTLMDDRTFSNVTNNHLAKMGIGATVMERVLISLSTFRLTFIPRTGGDGSKKPIWQLQGMPVSDNLKDHQVWLRIIRRTTFLVDQVVCLEPDKAPFGCIWCKAETHSNENCPLPSVDDWKGPIPDPGYLTPDPLVHNKCKQRKR
ncbi:hypothetical protein L208DRAFT_1307241 [Tricholoma matsutake]|nr:hypothetical protein L208DRAFT_1307241 [Tricholoma matsutake 945]